MWGPSLLDGSSVMERSAGSRSHDLFSILSIGDARYPAVIRRIALPVHSVA